MTLTIIAITLIVAIGTLIYFDDSPGQFDEIIREMNIANAAQNAVPMKCGTCRMFSANKCHRVAPFADVVETDFCMKYDINPKCDEYISARKAAEEAFNG